MATMSKQREAASRKMLRPFAEKYSDILTPLESMPTKKLERLLAACNEMNESNCWWAVHRASKMVREEIEGILRRRSLPQNEETES